MRSDGDEVYLPLVLRSVYYELKPVLPWRLRLALRRDHARRQRARSAASWPILESAGRAPEGWSGWPNGKRFAFVLTHDVEGSRGVDCVRALAGLEAELGFRSCFNFVPEGARPIPKDLRAWLAGHGFEVGVHDLRHDGKLYRSRRGFRAHAQEINRHLKDWGAVGFRSAFMLHKLDWLHDLNILYDASTFDTDPFEPQPDGVHTIFPFWVPAAGEGRGYVELPYTLPQDSTLFLVLQEPGSEIWKQKLDWIVEHGGMALLDTHPDYMTFSENGADARTYRAQLYRDFLQYVTDRYGGEFWHPLPREMATFIGGQAQEQAHKMGRSTRAAGHSGRQPRRAGARIWIDLDNTPHVPFFMPIIAELRERGHEVVVTARDAFQVCDLADFHGLKYCKIGRHYGKQKLAKVLGLFYRATQLMPVALAARPTLAVSHGSRSQIIACNLLRIPSILIADYEHAQTPPLMRPKWELAPESIPSEVLHCRNGRVRKYSGIKEDVYAWTLTPDASVLKDLGVGLSETVALVRPPANEAHYHNPESERLFERAMNRLRAHDGVRIVLLPRNRKQEDWIRSEWPEWFVDQRVVIPTKAIDGLNLIWHADFVISGGGTMNRESAALGVPVYSIFRGPIGAVDRHLESEGRLTLVKSIEEVDSRIAICRRARPDAPDVTPRPALREIVDQIESILALETRR